MLTVVIINVIISSMQLISEVFIYVCVCVHARVYMLVCKCASVHGTGEEVRGQLLM